MSTLGETFRTARSTKGIKLSAVAEKTRIPQERLQALEDDSFDEFADDVYAKGAIRNYAIYLGLDPDDAMGLYRAARPEAEPRTLMSVTATRRTIAVVPTAIGSVVVLILILIALVALHIIVL